MIFYVLSLFTGILECGWIAYGAVHAFPLWQILCFPLAYHIGNLFPVPFSLSSKYFIKILGACYVIGVFTCQTVGRYESINTVLTCICLLLLSVVIQSIRSKLKNDGNRLLKRVFRVGGFALAPLAAVSPSIILCLVSVLVTIIVYFMIKNGKDDGNRIVRMKGQKGFSLVMIFHQLHYFFYAYITLAAVSLVFADGYSWKGTLFAALFFCGTWITYMSVEPIVSRLTSKILPVFYIGHIGISILLLIMSTVGNSTLFTVLWLITGFGGGVVYTITAKAKADGCYDKSSMTISENIGHTLGLLAAVVIAALFADSSPHIMLVFGSVSAILAVITMLFTGKEKRS